MDVTPRVDITAATRYVRLSDSFRAFLSAMRRAATARASSSSAASTSGTGDGAFGCSVSCSTKQVTVPSPRRRAGNLVVSGENASGDALRREAAARSELFLGAKLVTAAAPERPAAMARGGVVCDGRERSAYDLESPRGPLRYAYAGEEELKCGSQWLTTGHVTRGCGLTACSLI
jgi:hypothetical protein